MSDIIEISDLELNDGLSGNWNDSKPSTNFGGGLEFLMNDKVKEGNKPSSDINLEDLKRKISAKTKV